MPDTKSEPLYLDPSLRARLVALAERQGTTLSDFAEDVLRAHADDTERAAQELAEDDRRWRRYLSTGEGASAETVREKLQRLAATAAQQADLK